jgi:hypothetical protein
LLAFCSSWFLVPGGALSLNYGDIVKKNKTVPETSSKKKPSAAGVGRMWIVTIKILNCFQNIALDTV